MRRDGRATAGPTARARPRRRDRRGRGVRGRLAPVEVPLNRTRAEQFDELVMDAVDDLERQWGPDLGGLEFAVQDVPQPQPPGRHADEDTVFDRGVPLGRLFRTGLDTIREPVVIVYRRPIETRALDIDDRADVVFMVVLDLVAQFLGRDVDEIDPPR